MIYALGSLSIKVAPFNVSQVSRDATTDFVAKPVIGAEPPMEYVGEGANKMTLSGQLLPRKLGGLSELDHLHQMRASGQPQYLMRGDGTPFGWHVIESVAERSTYLDARGVGQVIEVTITLRRAGKPAAGAFFSVISNIIGLFQ
ncbi:hypothetical protein SAMN05892877_13218 [Rhizobium subbaraonis]|uniref:Phage protein U n=1 Tax=Rhizobium subbaraonis TaxID=908946 RepID=A0A285V255_9HYPH|nr:phage tail protein [Rhizobium subbaraonis]SOC47668.1 hypothetical protein SAMN05892877_13218 [Rhizobium subbaraonis]